MRLPVAGLPLDVEGETRGASHRRQPGHADLAGLVAPRIILTFEIISSSPERSPFSRLRSASRKQVARAQNTMEEGNNAFKINKRA